jgi:hypothetical protein
MMPTPTLPLTLHLELTWTEICSFTLATLSHGTRLAQLSVPCCAALGIGGVHVVNNTCAVACA